MAPPEPQTLGAPAAGAPATAFLAVVRAADRVVLAQHSDRGCSAEELRGFEAALKHVLERAARLPAYPGWRDRMPVGEYLDLSGGPCLYALADAQALCIVAVGVRTQGCSERVAYGLLQELVSKVRLAEPEQRLCEAGPGKLSSSLRGVFKEIMLAYSDPAKVDKVAEVHEKVDKVKGLMQDNVKKILETHVSLEALQTKSETMSASADQFLRQSVGLRRQVQLRNLRVKAVAIACTGALALYLLMPFID